jgi:hypothetical protein
MLRFNRLVNRFGGPTDARELVLVRRRAVGEEQTSHSNESTWPETAEESTDFERDHYMSSRPDVVARTVHRNTARTRRCTTASIGGARAAPPRSGVKPRSGHERASLTNRESVIRREVADPRITHGRYHAQSGKGTAPSRTLEFLLECTSIASSRILAPRYLHVVRHGRGWHDGAIGLAKARSSRSSPPTRAYIGPALSRPGDKFAIRKRGLAAHPASPIRKLPTQQKSVPQDG